MPVLGVGLGNQATVMTTVGRSGVAVIRNDVSERLTPSLVAFTPKERLVGDDVVASIKSNYPVTCRCFKNLLGATGIESKEILEIESKHSLTPIVANEALNGLLCYQLPDGRKISGAEALAVYLYRLRLVGERTSGVPLDSTVIGVPSWFNQVQRKAVLDACRIAGITCHRVMNEHTAIALNYGLFRSAEFDPEKAVSVAFVDAGYSSTRVFIASFTRSTLKIVNVFEDPALGGRDIDRMLMQQMASAFEQQNKTKLSMEKKTVFLKLEEQAARAKKTLSANKEVQVHIECLNGEDDLQMLITRDVFEKWCEPQRERLVKLLKLVLDVPPAQQLPLEKVELCGGCSRVPWIQQTIQDVFNQNVSRTMDSDECVARGAAVQCAMIDPQYRVKDFQVVDRSLTNLMMVMLHSKSAVPNQWESWPVIRPNKLNIEDCHLLKEYQSNMASDIREVLPKMYTFPTSKSFSFPGVHSTEVNFALIAADLSTGKCHSVGAWQIRVPPEVAAKQDGKLKVKIAVDIHGIVHVDASHHYEVTSMEKQKEKRKKLVPAPTPTAEAPAAEQQGGDQEMAEAAAPSSEAASSSSAPETPMPSGADTEMANPPTAAPGEPQMVEVIEEVEVERPVTHSHRSPATITTIFPVGWLDANTLSQLEKDEHLMRKQDKETESNKILRNDILTLCYEIRRELSDPSSEKYAVFGDKREAILKRSNELDEHVEFSPDLSTSELQAIWNELNEITALPAPNSATTTASSNTSVDAQPTAAQ